MTIANRSELRAQIVDYLGDRTDLSEGQLNVAIGLAEAEMNRLIKPLAKEIEIDITLDSKVKDLPSDFRGVRRIYLDASPAVVLRYSSAENFWLFDQGTTNGLPCVYTIQGEAAGIDKELVVSPTPDTAYTAKLLYFSSLELPDDTSTNTILQNHADIYLYGALKHAAILLQDEGAASLYDNQFKNALREFDKEDNFERVGTGSLQPKSFYNEAPYRSFN